MNQDYIQPNEWSIIEEGFDVERVKSSESLFSIGNGAMGQRANFEEQYLGVDVPADRVEEVIASDGQAVAIAGHDPDREFGTARLDASGEGRGTSVNRMESVGVHVVREATGTTDARYEHDILSWDAEVGHDALNVGEDRGLDDGL